MRAVMLCGSGDSSLVVYNRLKTQVNFVRVIVESAPSRRRLLLNRVKKIGFIKTTGQAIFIVLHKLFRKFSEKKRNRLLGKLGFNLDPIDSEIIKRVDSINTEYVVNSLRDLSPDLVIVNGTRIIGKSVLKSTKAPFINAHMGITPKYRGVHGAYWALVNEDIENCGVTVHMVDSGIDTGSVIYQAKTESCSTANFDTYPLYQLADALPLLEKTIEDIRNDDLKVFTPDLPSQLWYHPTILQYVYYRLTRGVK